VAYLTRLYLGNVTGIGDRRPHNQGMVYAYDDLDRLKSYSVAGTVQETHIGKQTHAKPEIPCVTTDSVLYCASLYPDAIWTHAFDERGVFTRKDRGQLATLHRYLVWSTSPFVDLSGSLVWPGRPDLPDLGDGSHSA
jgi:hypothetical protein